MILYFAYIGNLLKNHKYSTAIFQFIIVFIAFLVAGVFFFDTIYPLPYEKYLRPLFLKFGFGDVIFIKRGRFSLFFPERARYIGNSKLILQARSRNGSNLIVTEEMANLPFLGKNQSRKYFMFKFHTNRALNKQSFSLVDRRYEKMYKSFNNASKDELVRYEGRETTYNLISPDFADVDIILKSFEFPSNRRKDYFGNEVPGKSGGFEYFNENTIIYLEVNGELAVIEMGVRSDGFEYFHLPYHLSLLRKIQDEFTNDSPVISKRIVTCYKCNSNIDFATDLCSSCGVPAPRCIICLIDLNYNEDIGTMECCGSLAHKGHLMSWLTDHDTCPICKAKHPKIAYSVIQMP